MGIKKKEKPYYLKDILNRDRNGYYILLSSESSNP